jgi:hypothetical protein
LRALLPDHSTTCLASKLKEFLLLQSDASMLKDDTLEVCCYIVVTLFLPYCYPVATRLLHCCYTVATLLLHCCYALVTLLLHCWYTLVTLL